MAHFQYPMRRATEPERWAFAYPREEGVMKPRLDRWSFDIGTRLVAKSPFMVDDFLVLERDEYVIVERAKDAGKYHIRCLRDNRIALEATAEEIDSHFYIASGPERSVSYSFVYPLLGKTEHCGCEKPPKVIDKEEDDREDGKESKKE